MRLREGLAVGAASAALGVGGALFISKENNDPVREATAAAAPANTQADAAKLCDVVPYGEQDYKAKVGPDLVSDLGKVAGSQLAFEGDAVQVSQKAAKELAPNNAGLSVIYTIIKAERGITPAQVVNEASATLTQMEQNDATRKQVCAGVVGRVLLTPKLFDLASRTSRLATYSPEYDADDNFAGLSMDVKAQTEPVQVFGIKPVSGSKNEALNEAISNSWGITAEGDVIQVAEDQGEAKITHHGRKISVKHRKAGVPAGAPQHEQQNGSRNESQSGTQGVQPSHKNPQNQQGPVEKNKPGTKKVTSRKPHPTPSEQPTSTTPSKPTTPTRPTTPTTPTTETKPTPPPPPPTHTTPPPPPTQTTPPEAPKDPNGSCTPGLDLDCN